MNVTVWSMTIDHRHGIDTTVHATEGEAWAHLRQQFLDEELWSGTGDGELGEYLTVHEGTPYDVLSEWLTNGYNDVSFYGPDPWVIDVPVDTLDSLEGQS